MESSLWIQNQSFRPRIASEADVPATAPTISELGVRKCGDENLTHKAQQTERPQWLHVSMSVPECISHASRRVEGSVWAGEDSRQGPVWLWILDHNSLATPAPRAPR